MFSRSLDTVRLHDCFGQPLLVLRWRFHSMAMRVVLFGAFLRVWPIHYQFLRFIVVSTSCPARAHSSSFVMTFGQKIPSICLGLLFRKDCTLESRAFVKRQVSDPYSNTDLTLELNILRLVFREIALDFHTDLRVANACCAFLIRATVSPSIPPDSLTTLIR